MLLHLLCLMLLAPAPQDGEEWPDYYKKKRPARDGIGKVYMGREISFVMGHLGMGWLERPEREREERPDLVIKNMELEPDSVVADIGAGSGYFAFRIAPKVPQGQVLAVDIQEEMLAEIRRRKTAGTAHVKPIKGAIDNPNLPEASVDAVLMVDVYHEFSHPREMMEGIVKALKPGGRVYLIEYRGEDPSIPIFPLHKMTQRQARKEMKVVGLNWIRTERFLPTQHFMVFEKPE